ncbi:enoyl-CoA hydratase/isomerase [Burkholderia sp. Ac-20379]|uniref:enoyl-CoA hydratase/isomerase n=1 Tax=Burkholderia sp. Ac-20379 TaxID=2703900 RepID=UPI00197D23F2|nr:enoyl-CoA hydratase/isomerase [Burkholderia sp. Ac-20379]MBN3725609.1 enoyl-CoA hydratase/isomerase [Burkholderia sp. Ac-20379]
MRFDTLAVERRDGICRVRFDRPEADNAIDSSMVAELGAMLSLCEHGEAGQEPVRILILEGSPTAFCVGGDLQAFAAAERPSDPEPLYDVWLRMARGPFVTISVVRGRVNAGGVGIVSASDIVLADRSASFSLSELLFGLYPACVMPFLMRRIGEQRAHYLTLTTRAFGAEEAASWGLVDALDDDVAALLRKHLLRLKLLSRPAIARYKRYTAQLVDQLERSKALALDANREMFGDPDTQRAIRRYVTESKFPWEP